MTEIVVRASDQDAADSQLTACDFRNDYMESRDSRRLSNRGIKKIKIFYSTPLHQSFEKETSYGFQIVADAD